jgi:hypothetical protein
MRIIPNPHHEEHHYHLPHQALWFVLMLIALFLLWSKTAFTLL